MSNQKSCGVLRFQECLGFRWNWPQQTMFVGHEFSDQRTMFWVFTWFDLARYHFSIVVNLCKETHNAVQFGEIDRLQNIADSDRFSSTMLCLTGTKLDVFFASKACWRMDSSSQSDSVISIDFHRSRCASFFAIFALKILVTDFRILPSSMWRLDLDDLAAMAWKFAKPQAFFTLRFRRFNDWRQMWSDVLRLRCHSNRKIGKECELVNSNTKSFGWKRLALSDDGTGPQQNLKKRQKKVSTLDVSYSPGQLQPILHNFRWSLHVN